MIAKTPSPPRVAIIRDYNWEGDWSRETLDTLSKLVLQSQPDAVIEHFQPIDGGNVPDAPSFDLVILTGGTADLTLPQPEPWVANLLDWIRDTVANSPTTKLLGICWGHQAISRALGGTIDVKEIPLTERGQQFFKGYQSLQLYKFHRREVQTPPPGVHYLAENFEISMSDSGQVMTFQGHPEMTPSIAQGLVDHRDPAYLPDPTPEGLALLHKALQKAEDGKKIFPRIMAWAFEGQV
ncbi:hypothetical protein A1O1_08039 [Capronia coronata CBS 617.96]|uniref:Glutamine amidotransferase domain-containing protein n=1 Tax=Capronia coronata CBS 617.96 TaxID=1182541 RepID=W9XN63_9EURO|nr:uncharacterized protein A1O1_08039 [Capronia coronata CBS 617.96]EXJ81972.1 hypothetical protein A1O1_08039 [Capronia coronata CBS 617.96]